MWAGRQGGSNSSRKARVQPSQPARPHCQGPSHCDLPSWQLLFRSAAPRPGCAAKAEVAVRSEAASSALPGSLPVCASPSMAGSLSPLPSRLVRLPPICHNLPKRRCSRQLLDSPRCSQTLCCAPCIVVDVAVSAFPDILTMAEVSSPCGMGMGRGGPCPLFLGEGSHLKPGQVRGWGPQTSARARPRERELQRGRVRVGA